MKDIMEMTEEEYYESLKDESRIIPPYIRELENSEKFSGVSSSKLVQFRVRMSGSILADLCKAYGTNVRQEIINRLISEKLDIPKEELIGPTKQGEKAMARPTKPDTEKRKTRTACLTDDEFNKVKGNFKNVANGMVFLSNLMIRMYEEGGIPEDMIKQEMERANGR